MPFGSPSTHVVPSAPVVKVTENEFGPLIVKTAPASGACVARSNLVTRIPPNKFGVGVALAVDGGVCVIVGVGGTGVLVAVGVEVLVGVSV